MRHLTRVVITLGQPFARFSEARGLSKKKRVAQSNKPVAILLRKEHAWDLNYSRRKRGGEKNIEVSNDREETRGLSAGELNA